MSLLSDSSIALLPDGGKASKLYSLIPSDGTGDFTVVRALDTATRVDENGLIVPVLANVPRIDFAEGTGCGSLLVEPTRENIEEESGQLETLTYVNSEPIANNSVSPDGTTTATTFRIDNTTDNRHRALRNYSVVNATTYTVSVFAKARDEEWIQLVPAAGTGFGNLIWANFNLVTGVVGNTGVDTINPTIESYPNGWYRISMTMLATATGTNSIDILSTNNTDSSRYPRYSQATPINCFDIWGLQFEEGAYPTSYIPTSGGVATRNADVISLTGVSQLIGQSQGSLMVELKSFSTDTYYISLSDTVNNRAFIKVDNFELFVAGVKQCDVTQAVDFGVYSKTLISYAPADYKIAVDGNVNTTVGIDNQLTFPPNTLTTVSFNNLNISSGFPFYGRIKSLLIYKTALDSDASKVLSGYATYNELAINKNYTVL